MNNTREVKTASIYLCSRCGENHFSLEFIKFKKPIVDSDNTIWNWWAICPTNGDPIIMKDIKEQENLSQ